MRKLILSLFLAVALLGGYTQAHATALQLDFFLSAMLDVSGDPLSGAIVVTKNSAASAAKAVWEDRDQTLPSSLGKSQFTLDSEGRAEVFGNGVYTVIIYDSADTGLTSPLYTFSGVEYKSEQGIIDDLAGASAGSGSDLVAWTGTAYTVTEGLDDHESRITVNEAAIAVNVSGIAVNSTSLGTVALSGYLGGLTLSHEAATPSLAVTMQAGGSADSTGVEHLRNPSAFTKTIDVDWVAGSGTGGFPSALTLTNTTWYHFFIISKADGTVDAGYDTSATAANLLADATDFTLYRHIGWIYYVDGSDGILPFDQIGGRFEYRLSVIDLTLTTTLPTTQTAIPLTIPPDNVVALTNYFLIIDAGGTSTQYGWVVNSDATDTVPGAGSFNFIAIKESTDTLEAVRFELYVPGDQQIMHRWSAAVALDSLDVVTYGFIDARSL